MVVCVPTCFRRFLQSFEEGRRAVIKNFDSAVYFSLFFAVILFVVVSHCFYYFPCVHYLLISLPGFLKINVTTDKRTIITIFAQFTENDCNCDESTDGKKLFVKNVPDIVFV